MMRAIIIDDENLAIQHLERQLIHIGGVEIIGKFQCVSDALEQVKALLPHVIFLDIDMPEISGIEAAEMIQQMNLNIDIVFVTAYEEYAVKAFEYDAVDYILKPVNNERLSRTIQRLAQHQSIAAAKEPDPVAATIRCFQRLNIDYGKPEPFLWRTTRSQELFAYMVYKRNQPVRKDVLLELFWPNTEYKKAYTQLYTTIYQIRKSMETAGLDIRLTNSSSDYYLDIGNNDYDVQHWEETKLALPELSPDTAHLHFSWLQAYAGDYLSEHDYIWAENERQRLCDIWYEHALLVSQTWMISGHYKEALHLYEHIEHRFPYSEEVFFRIMQFHADRGNYYLTVKKYEQLCSMLEEEYGIMPSLHIQQWVRDNNKEGITNGY
jgi:two-component system LytT family response regulator